MYILSVDDSKTMRKIIGGTVELLGYSFLEASNGKEALEVLNKTDVNEIAIILLDWNMPEMDGFTLLKTIKADERLKNIPVIMVTTESERTKVIDAVKAGAKNYLTKPFTQEELAAKINDTLGISIL